MYIARERGKDKGWTTLARHRRHGRWYAVRWWARLGRVWRWLGGVSWRKWEGKLESRVQAGAAEEEIPLWVSVDILSLLGSHVRLAILHVERYAWSCVSVVVWRGGGGAKFHLCLVPGDWKKRRKRERDMENIHMYARTFIDIDIDICTDSFSFKNSVRRVVSYALCATVQIIEVEIWGDDDVDVVEDWQQQDGRRC